MVQIETKYKGYLIGVGVLVIVGLIAWNVFSISDNGQRIDTIKSELEQSREYNSNAQKRLDTLEKRLSDSANRVNISTERIVTVERRIEADQVRLDEGQRIIVESRNILDQVRKRGQ